MRNYYPFHSWVAFRNLYLLLASAALQLISPAAHADPQYAFRACDLVSQGETWCRVRNTSQSQRRDHSAGPLGASSTFTESSTLGLGYVPPGVTRLTAVLALCSGANYQGDCASGQTTRKTVEGGSFACSGGESWRACMHRVVGPRVLEAPFTGNENGSCLMFRDQRGAYWSTNYYGYACGDAKLPPSTPDNCTVTSSTSWDITFGNIERGDIPTTDGTEKTKDLTITCTGSKAHDFSIKLSMTPTNWSKTQLATSNPALGIQVTVGDVATDLGSSFTMTAQGTTSKTLGFSVLRDPKVDALSVSTGAFTASGTLIVTEQ